LQKPTAGLTRATHRYDPAGYGNHCAEFYDQIYRHPPKQMITALASLASGGPVLELGIATGRVAIRLADMGLSVTGIEISSRMLRLLFGKMLPASITVVSGDFTTVDLPGLFPLVICIHSTILLLPQKSQRTCFVNVAKHLSPAGTFLIEAASGPPDLVNPPKRSRGTTRCCLVDTIFGARNYRVTQYYTPVEELDKMASDAGLVLVERWADWRRTPLVGRSSIHISLYVRSDASSESRRMATQLQQRGSPADAENTLTSRPLQP